MKDVWVDREGKIHEGGTHWCIASRLFPKSKNPELSCEKARYVKLGTMLTGSPMMENYDPQHASQAQINMVELLWEEHYSKKGK